MGQIKNTKLDINVSNEKLLSAAKCKRCNFYFFWDIKGKQTGG